MVDSYQVPQSAEVRPTRRGQTVSGLLAHVKFSQKGKEESISELNAVSKRKLDAHFSNSLTHEINAFGQASRPRDLI